MLKVAESCLVIGFLSLAAWSVIVGWHADDRGLRIALESSFVPDLVQPGATLDSQGLLVSRGRTVVLFMSTTCPFRDGDVEFYRAAATQARRTADAHFVVVSDGPPDAVRRWLDNRAIEADHQPDGLDGLDLYTLGVFATPTVVATNELGVVTDVIVGALTPAEEERFLAALSGGEGGVMNNLPDPRLVDHETFTRVAGGENVRLLDVRDRAEYRRYRDPQATNIPADELGIRAHVEMAASERLFVDCRVGVVGDCRHAARRLVLDGFTDVAVIVR